MVMQKTLLYTCIYAGYITLNRTGVHRSRLKQLKATLEFKPVKLLQRCHTNRRKTNSCTSRLTWDPPAILLSEYLLFAREYPSEVRGKYNQPYQQRSYLPQAVITVDAVHKYHLQSDCYQYLKSQKTLQRYSVYCKAENWLFILACCRWWCFLLKLIFPKRNTPSLSKEKFLFLLHIWGEQYLHIRILCHNTHIYHYPFTEQTQKQLPHILALPIVPIATSEVLINSPASESHPIHQLSILTV